MTHRRVSAALFFLIASSAACAEDPKQDQDCLNAGQMLASTLYQLEACQRLGALGHTERDNARKFISTNYPALAQEIQANGELSQRAHRDVEASPFDFRQGRNRELLASMCRSSAGLMHTYAQPDWQTVLACWK